MELKVLNFLGKTKRWGVREDEGRSKTFLKASFQSTREGRKILLKVSSYGAGGSNGPSSVCGGGQYLKKKKDEYM